MNCEKCFKDCKYNEGFELPCMDCEYEEYASTSKICTECIEGECQFKSFSESIGIIHK